MISYYARYSIKIMSCFFGHNCDVAPLLRLSFGYRRIVGNPSFIAPAILLKVCSQFNLYCLISQTVFNIQGCNCFMEQISEDLRKHCSCRKFSKTQSSIVTNRILDSFQFVSHTWGSSAPLIVIRPKVVLTLVKISIGLFPFTMKDCTLGLNCIDIFCKKRSWAKSFPNTNLELVSFWMGGVRLHDSIANMSEI